MRLALTDTLLALGRGDISVHRAARTFAELAAEPAGDDRLDLAVRELRDLATSVDAGRADESALRAASRVAVLLL